MLTEYRQSMHQMARAAKAMIPRRLCVTRLKEEAGRTVLLTFDDGPHPASTPAVLSRLRQFGARAIFFVVGCRIQRSPKMLSQILSEGHWLGNHSHSHALRHDTSYHMYHSDLGQCQETIYALTQTQPIFYRPPLGQLTLSSLMASRRHKLITILWSESAEDWRFHSDCEAVSCADCMLDRVKPRDILLFHDERLHTATALDKLLPGLQARGYSLSPRLEHIV